ncbi:MAG: hypothetical protein N4A35_00010 [Flavobacteriales bacterium]|jgi:outer membrane lipoprotein-sorting protein|nr:hypothetical protein [Flavobacteriales bacterium]
MKLIIINILVGLCFVFSGYGQDELMVEELTKLREVYQENQAFSVDIEYLLYLGNSSKVEEAFNAHLTRKSKHYKLTSKVQTSVVNDQYALTINHDEKMVLLQVMSADNHQSEVDPSSFDIASLLKIAHQTSVLEGLPKGKKGFRFEFYAAQYEAIDVVYNTQNYYIEKIVLKAHVPKGYEAQRIEIKYSNMNTAPKIAASTFSIDKYIQVKNQEARLTAAYKDYKLIN